MGEGIEYKNHPCNRDALQAQIQVITNEARVNLNSVQTRLDQVQREFATERQGFEVQLRDVQNVTKQVTVERDELLSKIDRLNNVKRREIITLANAFLSPFM